MDVHAVWLHSTVCSHYALAVLYCHCVSFCQCKEMLSVYTVLGLSEIEQIFTTTNLGISFRLTLEDSRRTFLCGL